VQGAQVAQVAGEREKLGAALACPDVAVEPVGGQVVASEQVPHSVGACVGGTSATSARPALAAGACGCLPVPAGACGGRSSLPTRMWLEVEWPELVEAHHHGGSPSLGGLVPSVIAYSSRTRFLT
jgi:hypothetical protein